MQRRLKEENLSLALRFIVDNFGKNTLLNAGRVESILSDLVPKFEKEKSWIIDAINSGVMRILLDPDLVDGKSRDEAIKKSQKVFKDNDVGSDRMNYILDNLSYALGWSHIKVGSYEDYKNKSNTNKVEDIPNTKVNLTKVDYTGNYQPNNNPNNQNNNNNNPNNQYNPNNNNNNPNNQYNPNNNNNPNNQYNQNNNNPKSNKLWLILIPIIIIVAILLLLGIKSMFGSGAKQLTVSGVTFNQAYEMDGNTYMFAEDNEVELTVNFDVENLNAIKNDDLSYNVDDINVCNYTKGTNFTCNLLGINEGSTVLHISYKGREIYSLKIGFGEVASTDDIEDTIVSVERISASSNVKEQSGTYYIPVNQIATIQPILSEGADYSKVSYSVDNIQVASAQKRDNMCEILGSNAQSTNLNILYDNQIIHSIRLTFEQAQQEQPDTPTIDEQTNNSDSSNFESNNDVDLIVKNYLANYPNAVNYGDVSYIHPSTTSSGELRKMLNTTVPDLYEKNISLDVVGYTKESMKKQSNGNYKTGYTIEYHIYKNGGVKYQKEYMEFIVVKKNGDWLIDKYVNWKLLEQRTV